MIPFGCFASISAIGIVRGTISEYTRASRTRRAISCAYCAPKSTTSTVSCTPVTSTPLLRASGLLRMPSFVQPASRLRSAAHPDALGPLERLALGLQ